MSIQRSSCTQCKQASTCSQKTRFLLNYCGSQRKAMEPSIHQARAECRMHRGSMIFRVLTTRA